MMLYALHRMRFDALPFSPQLVQARWEFGNLPSEELPRLAQDALENGYDGANTRRIAGLINPDQFDLQPLMQGFLAELGLATKPTREEAALALARFVAQAILERKVGAYEGARFIWLDIVIEMWPNQPNALESFVGNASEYEDCVFYSQHPEEVRKKIERDIFEAAQELIGNSVS
jgi:hypothetical protein